MGTRKISLGLKGQTQKERAAAGLVSTVVVTSMGLSIAAEDVLPSILASFKNQELEENRINSQKIELGQKVITRKGAFVFFANTPTSKPFMKTRVHGADINIILVDNGIDAEIENLVSQTKQDNLVFLSCLKTPSAEIRKEVKKTFGKSKVYTLKEIGRVLESKTVLNRKRHTRPHFFPDTIEQVGERLFKVTGTVDKGFVSTCILINGCIFGKIRDISVNAKRLDISPLALLTKEEIYGKKKDEDEAVTEVFSHLKITENSINDLPEYSDDSLGCINIEETEEETEEESSEDYENLEEIENEDESSEIKSDDLVGYGPLEKEKKEEFIARYKEFKGFKTINLGLHKKATDKENQSIKVFRTQNLPEYYKNLSFISSERARKKILAKKSPLPVHTSFELVFEIGEEGIEQLKQSILSGFLSIHGLFDYEGTMTICTLAFNTKENISIYNKDLVFDFGFVSAAPDTVVLGNGSEIVKCKTEGTTGTVCFIGPLVLTDNKVFISRGDRYVGTAVHAMQKDPIIIRTVVFKGIPAKIRKRSCIVAKMFRSREEVKYFKNIKLYSSLKKEGHIKKPLGEKGLMKCYFFPPVKHGEKIYMELARRVFITPDQPRI